MASALVVASGVAFAATISCPNRDGNLCVGTNNNDTMTGRNRADEMHARGGSDTLRARGDNDKLNGGTGNDSLGGAGGGDTYYFANGWGRDTVAEGGGVDTLDFSALSDGVEVNLVPSATSAEAKSGTSRLDLPFGAVIEKVRGGAGFDTLHANAANDSLSGGASQDYLYPSFGNDASNGGEGDDWYYFELNTWGFDTITDTTTPDNNPFTGNTVAFRDVTGDLTINLVSSDTQPEVNNPYRSTESSTIDWSNNAIDNIDGGAGDDTISGNPASNNIFAIAGNDNISTGGGDDFVWVKDGQPLDSVNCGEGTNDTVYRDGGDPPSVGCENQF